MENNNDHTEAMVANLPPCDFHRALHRTTVDAVYDGKTKSGPWANMCEPCFTIHGVGLGEGRGQRLFTPEQQIAEWEQRGFPSDYFQICDYFELDLRDPEAVWKWHDKAEDDARCERQAGY